jgi:hypothetical protein
MNRPAFVSLLAFGLLCAMAVAGAECPSDAAEILDRYIEATGGAAAYAEIENRVMRSVLEIPAAGFELPVVLYAARPDRLYSLTESEATGKIERGFTKGVAWENSLMAGPQILEGEQAALLKRSAFLDAVVNWREVFAAVSCLAVEQAEGHTVYRVELEGKVGPPETRYYDVDSGLMVKMSMTVELPQGKIPLETFPTDYRAVDGVLMAHTMRTVLVGQERTLRVQSVEHNVEMPAGRFDLPAEIQELVESGS